MVSPLGRPLWVWVGQRGGDALGLDRLAPLNLVVCCDDPPTATFGSEAEIFSLERETGHRRSLSNEALGKALEGDLGRKIEARFAEHDGPIYVVVYRSTQGLERLVEGKSGITVFASPVRWKDYFDNKVRFRRAVKRLGLPLMPGFVASDRPEFERVAKEVGCPFVLTKPIGSSGRKTALIADKESYLQWCQQNPGQQVIFTRYFEVPSINVNACVVDGAEGLAVLVGHPSVQLTGLECCGAGPMVYCGNDYGAAEDLPSWVKAELHRQMQIIGRWLAQKPFRGLFGVDFLLHEDRCYPLEVNPRFQNSTQLLTQLECLCGQVPLVTYHLRQFMPSLGIAPLMSTRATLPPASQVILHHEGPPRKWRASVLPGTYALGPDGLTFRSGDLHFTGAVGQVIVDGLARAGIVVHPNTPICRMQFSRRILSEDLRRLAPEIEYIARIP